MGNMSISTIRLFSSVKKVLRTSSTGPRGMLSLLQMFRPVSENVVRIQYLLRLFRKNLAQVPHGAADINVHIMCDAIISSYPKTQSTFEGNLEVVCLEKLPEP